MTLKIYKMHVHVITTKLLTGKNVNTSIYITLCMTLPQPKARINLSKREGDIHVQEPMKGRVGERNPHI